MTKKPHEDTRMAKYVERRVLELKPTKSQAEIAARAGYTNANMITMIKQGMRHLIDNYIKADDSEVISHLDDISLIDLIDSKGAAGVDDLPPAVRKKKENVAEAIENNVRRLIIDETPVNPKFYEKMSELLTDLVKQRRDEAIAYAEYLEKIADLVRQVKKGHGVEYPDTISTPGRKALYDNLNGDENLAMSIDEAIRETAQQGWRGSKMKERMLRRKLSELIANDDDLDRIFEIVRAQNEY